MLARGQPTFTVCDHVIDRAASINSCLFNRVDAQFLENFVFTLQIMDHGAVTSQPETQPASMQLEDKENTPPEGRSTPTLDERASSSQESLPCAVGLNFTFKWSPGLTPFCFRLLYCTYIVTNSAQTYGLCVFLLSFQQGPPSAQTLRVLHENSRGRGTHGVLNWPYPTVLDPPTPGGLSSRAETEAAMRSDYLASHSAQRMNPTPTGKESFLNKFCNSFTQI